MPDIEGWAEAADSEQGLSFVPTAPMRKFLAELDSPVDAANLYLALEYDDGVAMVAPIAAGRINGFGLHSVHGNVSEWCREAFIRAPLAYFQVDAGDGYHRVPTATRFRMC